MGTTSPDNIEKVHGVFTMAGKTVEVVTDTAYGDTKTRRHLYPLVLLVVAAVALVLTQGHVVPVGVGLVSLLLMGLWVGGSGR